MQLKQVILGYAHEQVLAMTNHLYNLVLHDVFKIMIAKQFYFTLIGKKYGIKEFQAKITSSWVEAEAIQKLPLPHPWFTLGFKAVVFARDKSFVLRSRSYSFIAPRQPC